MRENSLMQTKPLRETEVKMGDYILFERDEVQYIGKVLGFYTNSVLVEVENEPDKFGTTCRTVVNFARFTLFKKAQTQTA
ncbi:hypothetical protein MFLO_09342 [Listeria floridensis FSL S10-1187]|uniref:DUF2187 domain-containing protein n=1 Tax=Listeria floridensis FSL S10-1187 TaxID=1265817 RepID=A0ABN0REL3_9LIST|nr:DUF2187 family protein [Listeria floridensis]EUJ31246.1 hypothetical protein MFLO_09342 [Listeria floridensis FSL S10-1187]